MGDEPHKRFSVEAHNFWELKEILYKKYPSLKEIYISNRECLEIESCNSITIGFFYKYNGKVSLCKKFSLCESGVSSKCEKKIFRNVCYYKGMRVCSHCFNILKLRDTHKRRGRRRGSPNKKDLILKNIPIVPKY